MLQNVLVVEIIVVIFSLVLLVLGLHFLKKADNGDPKFFSISIVCFIAAILGTIYFLYHIFAFTDWNVKNLFISTLKVFIPAIIAVEIIIGWYFGSLDGLGEHLLLAFLVLVVDFMLIGIGGLIASAVQEADYQENVIEVEEQRYNEEKYELLEKFNTTDVDNIGINVSISSYFNIDIEELPEDWICEECEISDCEHRTKKIKTCEIYYISNKESLYKPIDGELIKFTVLKENEKPYILVKKYTRYSIDNNQNPPVECNIEDTYVYELHISKEELEKVSKLLNEK